MGTGSNNNCFQISDSKGIFYFNFAYWVENKFHSKRNHCCFTYTCIILWCISAANICRIFRSVSHSSSAQEDMRVTWHEQGTLYFFSMTVNATLRLINCFSCLSLRLSHFTALYSNTFMWLWLTRTPGETHNKSTGLQHHFPGCDCAEWLKSWFTILFHINVMVKVCLLL